MEKPFISKTMLLTTTNSTRAVQPINRLIITENDLGILLTNHIAKAPKNIAGKIIMGKSCQVSRKGTNSGLSSMQPGGIGAKVVMASIIVRKIATTAIAITRFIFVPIF